MKWVKPSSIRGTVRAPASKSLTIRAAAAAFLGRGETTLIGPSRCDDALAAFDIVKTLGARIEPLPAGMRVRGGWSDGPKVLDCGESGLSMRLFAPVCALRPETMELRASGSLRTRPMGMIEEALRSLGVTCRTNGGFAPIEIRGPLQGGRATLDGSQGSQLLTGLLMALPLCGRDSELAVIALKSRPYAAMTVSLLRRFGVAVTADPAFERVLVPGRQAYGSISYEIDGDWSGAAFLLAAGAGHGRVTVANLKADSVQADQAVLEALDAAGARIAVEGNSVTVENRGRLKGFNFDASECPDLFPPLAALACGADGRSRIDGVGRLKHKESDRGLALCEEFRKIGGRISIAGDRMEIDGARLEGGVIDARGDHRIAMAGAVAGLSSATGVGISGWACVAKSYPEFFDDLHSIGGDVS